MKIKAPAKINLNLHIFPKKNKNGFYPVSFLNCQVNLFDEIEIIKKREQGVNIKCPRSNECYSHTCLKRCLVYNAIELLQKEFPKSTGLFLKIKKHIPVKAGLGGGSSDAGVVIKYLCKAWKLNLSQEKMAKLSARVGKDVCYASIGGLCKVEGVGDIIEPLKLEFPRLNLIIITPDFKKPSTAWAYQNVDLSRIGKNKNKFDNIISAIKERNIKKIAENLHNDFEYLILKTYPEINEIKKMMVKSGALNALLCGSGLSCFGVYPDLESARKSFRELKKRFLKVFLVNTI